MHVLTFMAVTKTNKQPLSSFPLSLAKHMDRMIVLPRT
eukprot:COSAG06_NODE_2711_length_6401_cov_343.215192_10_plen_37_part_01